MLRKLLFRDVLERLAFGGLFQKGANAYGTFYLKWKQGEAPLHDEAMFLLEGNILPRAIFKW